MRNQDTYDVVILGAGLAGLTLARHLQLTGRYRILLVDPRQQLPPRRQKVGESTVQVGAYYLAKVLDLEEHLLHDHFMKYNLRFHWKRPGSTNASIEDYDQCYIRTFSNIPTYQVDRNRLEAHLLQLVTSDPECTLIAGAASIHTHFDATGLHTVDFVRDGAVNSVRANWVVDASGRNRSLARQLDTRQAGRIHHGSAFCWVDGLVDVGRLTDRSLRDRRLNTERRALGHSPGWLATNHFMGEGFWFWVIPLRGKTSLGVVYDRELFRGPMMKCESDLIAWICDEFPLFARDLPRRNASDFSAFKDFSYDCQQTISADRWAMTGEAGRFADPLYSPGADFIAIHNTLIVDAIRRQDEVERRQFCRSAESLMQTFFRSLEPTYHISYDVLGDQQAFFWKYSWELSVYFTFFVFPFINDLTGNPEFAPGFRARYSQLGRINRSLQQLFSAFYQWRKNNPRAAAPPRFLEFKDCPTLQMAEKLFYQVAVTPDEALELLDGQLHHLREFARQIELEVSAASGGRITIESLEQDSGNHEPLRRGSGSHVSGSREAKSLEFETGANDVASALTAAVGMSSRE